VKTPSGEEDGDDGEDVKKNIFKYFHYVVVVNLPPQHLFFIRV